jgi:hypothetical protein
MSIKKKGTGILVLEKSVVPVLEIAEQIASGKPLEWLQQRYPVGLTEIFDVINIVAETFDDWSDAIKLRNVGDEQSINLETVRVNNTMYFNLLRYGHAQDPTAIQFSKLYVLGLEKVLSDIYTDIKNECNNYQNSKLHLIVHHALLEVIGIVDPDQMLALLEKKNL